MTGLDEGDGGLAGCELKLRHGLIGDDRRDHVAAWQANRDFAVDAALGHLRNLASKLIASAELVIARVGQHGDQRRLDQAAFLAFASPSFLALSLVTIATSLSPPARSSTTSVLTGPMLTAEIVPSSLLRALVYISAPKEVEQKWACGNSPSRILDPLLPALVQEVWPILGGSASGDAKSL